MTSAACPEACHPVTPACAAIVGVAKSAQGPWSSMGGNTSQVMHCVCHMLLVHNHCGPEAGTLPQLVGCVRAFDSLSYIWQELLGNQTLLCHS